MTMTTKTATVTPTEAEMNNYLDVLDTAMKELSDIRKANKATDAQIRRLRTSTRKKLSRIRENLHRVETTR